MCRVSGSQIQYYMHHADTVHSYYPCYGYGSQLHHIGYMVHRYSTSGYTVHSLHHHIQYIVPNTTTSNSIPLAVLMNSSTSDTTTIHS